MSARTVIVIVLALVFGLVAALLVHQMANRPSMPGPSDQVDVLVAKVDIPPGMEIRETMIGTKPYDKDRLPPHAVTDKKDVLERAALMHILKDEPIVTARLTEKGQLGLAPLIKPGWRAFTVRVTDPAAGVGSFLLPRSKVDVLLTLKGRSDDAEGGPVTTVLLQNVEVLAVGSRLSAGADNSKKKGNAAAQRNVTFLVEPDHANKLQLGTNLGTLHMVLRHPDDNEEVEVEEATLASIRQGEFAGQAWQDQVRKNELQMDERFNALKESLVQMIEERSAQRGGGSGVAGGPNAEGNRIVIRTFQGDYIGSVDVIKQDAAPAPKQD